MGLLRKCLPCIKSAPEDSGVDENDIYPLHMLDNISGCREFFAAWTMRFNDVLDANQLHQSLSQLLEIGDWRKLGGRLHYKENGKLELHVPKKFTHRRPAVVFSCDASSSGISIEEHPLARRLPKAMAEPSLHLGSGNFRCFGARAGVPTSIKDLIAQDAPQISLHITTFNDATLVALSFPHTMMDALGYQALLRSWSLVLAGREDEVPPLLGARDDIIWATADESIWPKFDGDFVLGKQRLRGAAYLAFLMQHTWDTLRNPVVESKALHLPKSTIDLLRNQAMESITGASEGRLGETPFMSEGDILTAWLARIVALSESRARPLTIFHAINARFRLAPMLESPEEGVYVQNMVLASSTCLSTQMARGPMGIIALENRRQLAEKTTTQQMAKLVQIMRKDAERGREPMILPCGEPSSVPVVINNLTKVNIMGTADFKPAVLRQGEAKETRCNPTGTMVYHHIQALKPISWRRPWFVVLGKDYKGGTWLMLSLTQKSSLMFEEAVNDLKSRASNKAREAGYNNGY